MAGVGDMSGDVFGNGMLRERTIKLVAAFDHRDIFIDPDPDPGARLRRADAAVRAAALELAGFRQGAHLARAAASIRAPPRRSGFRPKRRRCSASARRLTPPALIRAILKAPVDLLFFGGIGTYVRAADESDEAVGDRANDAVRVAGADLRCKVIGEGANLGMTQRGRIEAALRGVQAQHRRHRQFGRRQHFRHGGQYQDRAEHPAARRPPDDGCAQRAPVLHDRRGRRPGAAQQLPADARALACRASRHGGFRLSAAPDPDPGSARAARPRRRTARRRHAARRAPPPPAAVHPAGACGPARLRQAFALRRSR